MVFRYEDLAANLSRSNVMKAAEKCIKAIWKASVEQHPERRYLEQKPQGPSEVKRFLVAFIIMQYPDNTFGNPQGNLESALRIAASELVQFFDRTCAIIAAATAIDMRVTADFNDIYCRYLDAFRAWLIPDDADCILNPLKNLCIIVALLLLRSIFRSQTSRSSCVRWET